VLDSGSDATTRFSLAERRRALVKALKGSNVLLSEPLAGDVVLGAWPDPSGSGSDQRDRSQRVVREQDVARVNGADAV
jgi:hypothetical protein